MRDEKLLISSNRYLYIFQLFEHSYEFESFYELPTYANHIIQLPENRLLLCLWDYSIRIWNSISFKPMRILKDHSNIITRIHYLLITHWYHPQKIIQYDFGILHYINANVSLICILKAILSN